MTMWIEWNGGECPLPEGAVHEVKFRNGVIEKDDEPETWYWAHDNANSDIIAYRLADPEVTPEEEEYCEQLAKSRSDGSTASYYQLPPGCTELQDLISYRNMNAQIGELFRAAYRYGLASHSEKMRDAKKIKFYVEAEIARLEKYE